MRLPDAVSLSHHMDEVGSATEPDLALAKSTRSYFVKPA